MTPFEYWWLYISMIGFPIMLLAFFGVIAAWVIYEKVFTPQEAKEIRKASRKKVAIALNATDDGFGDFKALDQTGHVGYASTTKDLKKRWTGFFARKTASDGENPTADFINHLATRKLYLRHAKIPIWFGYQGKAILTSLYSLIGIEGVEHLAEIATTSFNPSPDILKQKLENVKTKLEAVDVLAIKSLFAKPWDQDQQRANIVDATTHGILEGKELYGGKDLTKYTALIAFLVVLCVICALIMIFLR